MNPDWYYEQDDEDDEEELFDPHEPDTIEEYLGEE